MTNLLFFLLVGFAAQEIQFDAGNRIELPGSNTRAELEVSISVAVTPDQLLVEQVPVAPIAGGKIQAPSEDGKIVPLYDRLNAIRSHRQEASGGLGKGDDAILLVADRAAPYELLAPVMRTAAAAGFPNVRLAVVKR